MACSVSKLILLTAFFVPSISAGHGHHGDNGQSLSVVGIEDEILFLPDREPTVTKRDIKGEHANKTGNGCWFGLELQHLFNDTEIVKCSADLSGGLHYITRILFDSPKNPYKFYMSMNRSYCPLWIKGLPCIRKVLRFNCNDLQLYKMKHDNLINFLIPVNDVFCSDSYGSKSIFEFIKLGGSECMSSDESFQKPLDKCLNKNKFSKSPSIAKYFSTYQKCAAPLLAQCANVSDGSRLVPLLRKFFEDVYFKGREFWRDIDA